MSRKSRLLATVTRMEDASPGGILATSMRHLAHAAPTATGMTIISPDGTARYVSRSEAERFVFGSGTTEAKQ